MDIGAALRLIRLSQGRTQESVALEAGFQTSNLSRFERGEHTVTVDRLSGLASALNVKLSEVFRMSEDAAASGNGQLREDMTAYTAQTQALLHDYRALDSHDRQTVLRIVQEMAKAPRMGK